MKRMLINATQPEELRVAIAEGQHLFDLDIEVPSQEQKKSNVYKGKITRVEPSLEACFVEFGSTRHGFLPLKEICESCYSGDAAKKGGKIAIRDAVREGQEIIVQVEKEERGNKGAALTTYISLAGRYLVLMPTNPTAGGVSRRITGNDRDHLREQLQKVTTPDNVGIIVRTAGVGRDAEELQWDLDYLLQLWTAIEQAAAKRPAPFLIHQESNLFIRALRDHLRNDIGEILIDNESVYNDAREFIQQVMPHNLGKLKLYNDQVPLFNRYQIESQIESAFARTVHLPSGGAIVFDHTEALLSIDINSARATKGSDIEDTAYSTNMESAKEIARQLRLRDLGGLIVIDFIDMTSRKHQRDVEESLRKAMQIDKARVQIGRISRFGLLEMSRQRLRPSLGESSQETCPRCEGHGTIRSIESLALSILRLVEEEAMKDFTGQLIVQAPTEVINFLHNEKRSALAEVESRHRVPIVMLANQYLVTPHFEILRIRKSDVTDETSYSRVLQPAAEKVAIERSQAHSAPIPAPAVKQIVPNRPAPTRVEAKAPGKAPGLFARLAKIIFPHSKEDEKRQPEQRKSAANKPEVQISDQQSNRSAAQPAGQQQNRKPSKKRSSKSTQAGGQQQQPQQQRPKQRTGKKRTSKKSQAKASQGQQNQQPTQNQGGQRVNNPAHTGQKDPASGEAGTKETPTQSQTKTGATTDDANITAAPDAKEGGSRRGGRRRRSPYKTGGTKPRVEKAESASEKAPASQSGSQAPGGNMPAKDPDQAQSKPSSSGDNTSSNGKTDPTGSGADAAATKSNATPQTDSAVQASAESIPRDTKSPTEESKSKPKKVKRNKKDVSDTQATAGAADKTLDANDKPAKPVQRKGRKKSASKKAAKKGGKKTVASSKPETKPESAAESRPVPTTAAEKDSNGIYTLKPPPSG